MKNSFKKLIFAILFFVVKDAITKATETNSIIQINLLRLMAKHTGASPEEIDKVTLTEKQFKKRYSTKQLADVVK